MACSDTSPYARTSEAHRRDADDDIACRPLVGCRIFTNGKRVSGTDRGIDCVDGNFGDPIGMQDGFGERLINAGLIGAERTAALEQ
jgi:hypothetical protein